MPGHFMSAPSPARRRPPVLRIEQLDEAGLEAEVVEVLDDTRFIWTDDRAIRRDFDLPVDVAKERILASASIISSANGAWTEVNEMPRLAGRQRVAYRPPQYGRALIVEWQEGGAAGLLDVKGVGVPPTRTPVAQIHRNGLLQVGQALEEVFYQRVIDALFRAEGADVAGVPVYAVVDLGFRGRVHDSGLLPCAALVRQAHRRHPGGVELPAHRSVLQRAQLTIEFMLRRYGLTSANTATRLEIFRNANGELDHRYGGAAVGGVHSFHLELLLQGLGMTIPNGLNRVFEAVNIQTTRDVDADPLSARLVDFGHFRVARRFDHPVLSLVDKGFLNCGGWMEPDNANWPQPDELLSMNWDIARPARLGESLAEWSGADPEILINGPTRFSLELAREISESALDSVAAADRIETFIARSYRWYPSRTQAEDDRALTS